MSERFHEVVNAFMRYAKSVDGDRSEIEAISRQDLEFALVKYSSPSEKHDPFYRAMETRLAELKEQENQRRTRRQVWTERLVAFILGVVTSLLASYLLKKLGLG